VGRDGNNGRGTPNRVTFGTAIRIARVHHPSCLTWRASDLRFLRTVGDRWRQLMPVHDRCGTDPTRTELSRLTLR
jgi:hypothetical protein